MSKDKITVETLEKQLLEILQTKDQAVGDKLVPVIDNFVHRA
ncbi:hypothetical protein [Candidatus Tisiphia endosymbiont of Dioctria rufipes]